MLNIICSAKQEIIEIFLHIRLITYTSGRGDINIAAKKPIEVSFFTAPFFYNVASFVITEVDQECHSLMIENLNKNLVDTSQYGHTNEIQDRCVNILANFFHTPHDDKEDKGAAVGTATVGSSEATMLGGLALKWCWRAKQAVKQGKKLDEITTRCNLIFSAAVPISVLK